MKNADKPINPFKSIKFNGKEFFEYNLPYNHKQYSGLTKREYFAGLALQGTCSNQEFLKNLNGDPNLVIKACIEIADELLKQLENEN